MAKKQKQQQQEEPEENVKTDAYAHVTGPSRDYVIKILRRVEKAPRIRTTFEKLVEVVKRQKAEQEKDGKDVEMLDKLIAQLESFSDPKDSRKVADFNNYENKFVFSP